MVVSCWNPILLTTSAFVVIMISLQLHLTNASIGVNYGMLGDNLPSPSNVVSLYKRKNIPMIRLLEPHPNMLNALRSSSIKVAIGVKNDMVADIANDANMARDWVNTNISPFANEVTFGWITVGNEMVPGSVATLIPKAMENIRGALSFTGISGIKVSTVVSFGVLGQFFPPSIGDFSSEANESMYTIITWLVGTNNPIFVNIYPYYAYSLDPTHISFEYAIFRPEQPVTDGTYNYFSLFEAMVDAFVVALEKHGGANVSIVVAETGWPTAGNEPYSSSQKAHHYNQNLIDKMTHVGTPRRRSEILEIFIYAMFNENGKPSEIDQNWGFCYPNMDPVYPLTFFREN